MEKRQLLLNFWNVLHVGVEHGQHDLYPDSAETPGQCHGSGCVQGTSLLWSRGQHRQGTSSEEKKIKTFDSVFLIIWRTNRSCVFVPGCFDSRLLSPPPPPLSSSPFRCGPAKRTVLPDWTCPKLRLFSTHDCFSSRLYLFFLQQPNSSNSHSFFTTVLLNVAFSPSHEQSTLTVRGQRSRSWGTSVRPAAPRDDLP